MKKVLSIAFVIVAFVSCQKDKIIPTADMPKEIIEFTSTHFPNNEIIRSYMDKDGFTKTYEVLLEGGYDLEFNSKKEIIEIDGTFELPNSVIPVKIKTYVELNYPENVILAWALENNHQNVELDNDIELEFNMNGDFIRIDN